MVIDQKIINQIRYLSKQINKDEWSGILFCTIQGSIKDANNCSFTAIDILLMDKGSVAYTCYEFDESVVAHVMNTPILQQLMFSGDLKICQIHSHNYMGVFFSGTDNDELNDNSKNHNVYLSVIVNNYLDIMAKVAFRGKTTLSKVLYSCLDENGEEYNVSYGKIEKEVLFMYECDIVTPPNDLVIEDKFAERVKFIQEKAIKKAIEVKKSTSLATIPKSNYVNDPNKKIYAPKYDNWGQDWGSPVSWNTQDVSGVDDASFYEVPTIEIFGAYILRLGKTEALSEGMLEDAIIDIEVQGKSKFKVLARLMVADLPIFYKDFYKTENSLEGDEGFLNVLGELTEELTDWAPAYTFVTELLPKIKSLHDKLTKQIITKV